MSSSHHWSDDELHAVHFVREEGGIAVGGAVEDHSARKCHVVVDQDAQVALRG